ncbi:MAG: hypothetical protein R3B74_12835 [Nitrospirales bacterium]|nr:hypothetical protein [Nitrospirales bacterium]
MRWFFAWLIDLGHSYHNGFGLAASLCGFLLVCGVSHGYGQQLRVAQDEPREFSARLIWKTGGHVSKAQLFVKHDRYRIEHFGGIRTDLGYAGVTIVRLDEQKVWYVLSQRRMVISVPLTAEYILPLSVALEGEQKRTLIGEGQVEDRPALLYEVSVRNRFVGAERYYQWVDPERDVLWKLMSQDRDWFIEYQHVVISPQPDFYFEPPLGYRVIEAQNMPMPKG